MSTVILINRLRSSRNPYPGEIVEIKKSTDEELRKQRFYHVCELAHQKRELANRRRMDEETERLADMAMENNQ